MTTDKTPTDAEIAALYADETGFALGDSPAALLDFARAVLAKWGSPVVVGEPMFWYRPVCGGDMYEGPFHTNSADGKMLRAEKPDEWKPLFTTPQRAQAQAGAVPLTCEQIVAAAPEYYVDAFLDFNAGVRFAEQHYGIKGGQQ